MVLPYKLLVFDWDGTLMDSEARIVSCLSMTLSDLALPALGRDELLNVIGLGLPEAVATLLPEADAGLIRRFIDRYRYHFLSDHHAAAVLFPGAKETLTALDRRGYLLAVATGKGRRGLDQSLEDTGCGGLFSLSRCADETASKPNPRMLIEIMDVLGIAPDETLMIGDTEYDMQMAHNAGARALAVSYGVHARERLLACEPLGCLDVITDILPWLEGVRREA
ncbi:MAG: HAD-IA family hydrolase [Gammaproteobacteria bacterium]|nr:HAD-IA family hydrolase [Gammaproteobacteria bacterium]